MNPACYSPSEEEIYRNRFKNREWGGGKKAMNGRTAAARCQVFTLRSRKCTVGAQFTRLNNLMKLRQKGLSVRKGKCDVVERQIRGTEAHQNQAEFVGFPALI